LILSLFALLIRILPSVMTINSNVAAVHSPARTNDQRAS
jgi:hypothetical protein